MSPSSSRIARELTLLRFTKTNAAELTGVGRVHLTNVVNGRKLASPRLQSALAALVGLRTSDLFDDDGRAL